MAQDKAFAFDPLDVFTVVVITPVGTEVSYAKYSELDTLDVPEVGPGISVEVIPPAREDGSARAGVSLERGQSVADVAKRVTTNENRRRKAAAEPEAEEAVEPNVDVEPSGDLYVAEGDNRVRRSNSSQSVTDAEVKRAGPKASTGPVGPDPKQEAARARAVTGATGPRR
jgi:hypothetical protein